MNNIITFRNEDHNEIHVTTENRNRAEQCLIDNGIDKDEACVVLQALGYILLDTELYPEC